LQRVLIYEKSRQPIFAPHDHCCKLQTPKKQEKQIPQHLRHAWTAESIVEDLQPTITAMPQSKKIPIGRSLKPNFQEEDAIQDDDDDTNDCSQD